jgi:hypothetical protein
MKIKPISDSDRARCNRLLEDALSMLRGAVDLDPDIRLLVLRIEGLIRQSGCAPVSSTTGATGGAAATGSVPPAPPAATEKG